MMAPDTLERQLTDWLADAATPRDVELADVYAQTRSMSWRVVPSGNGTEYNGYDAPS